jgi:AsmA protein
MPITLEVLGAQGSGSILVDFAAGTPQYQVQFSLPQFNIASFFDTLAQEQATEQPALGTGTMDFSARLSMQGKTIKEITRSANGNFSLRGENLRLNGTDLDSRFEEFESSQHFSLVDVGAFFYAGPLGLVLTKGYDFTGILRGSGGQSEISSLVSEWQVEGGVAKAIDVAMATTKNRIALHGNLDFVNGRYNEVTVALIDGDGCAVVKQEIHGNFLKPAVEQPNILKSLAGPVISLLEKGRDLFPGDECEVFYVGSVAHPK